MVTEDPDKPLLKMLGITKYFPGVRALDGVDLEVRAGEVHCLLGQNGAGKSTLIKILSGAYQPDAGTIEIDGVPVEMTTPQVALDAGIATMYQELDVVDGLSVAENIYLGHEFSRGGLLRLSETRRRARALLESLGHPEIRPSTEVGSLSAAGKQIVSMARALSHKARVIIMDEPSAVLDSEEVENLFEVVERLKAQDVAVIYISHRLDEIRRIGDRITVLKDGITVAQNLPARDTSTEQLIQLMTGRRVEYLTRPEPKKDAFDPEVLLTVEDLSLEREFNNVSFEVQAGEILGLAGLVGSGRSEILETVFGARKASKGEVRVRDKVLSSGSVPAAVEARMGLCPEERKSQALILDEALFRNITLANFADYAKLGFLDEDEEKEMAAEQGRSMDVRPLDLMRAARTFSGGNQQKLILARWLLRGCDVLLLDEPTRGVDVGARAEIYELIYRLANEGAAILVVSSEIPEVIHLSDRVLVVSEGEIVADRPAADITEEDVLGLVMEGTMQ